MIVSRNGTVLKDNSLEPQKTPRRVPHVWIFRHGKPRLSTIHRRTWIAERNRKLGSDSESGHVADAAELVFSDAVELVIAEASIAEQNSEDEREDGVAVVVIVVDLLAPLGQPRL